jgi:hypothetical protein
LRRSAETACQNRKIPPFGGIFLTGGYSRPGCWLTVTLAGVALPIGILLLLTGLLSAALLLLAGLLTRVLILLSRVVLVLIGHSSISLLNHSARIQRTIPTLVSVPA